MRTPSPDTATFRASAKDENIEKENKYYPEEREGTSTTQDYEAHETEPPTTTPRINTIINLRLPKDPTQNRCQLNNPKGHISVSRRQKLVLKSVPVKTPNLSTF